MITNAEVLTFTREEATSKPTVLDLFAGAGGTGLGFTLANFQIVAAVEKEAFAAETYARNLAVPVLQNDIRRLTPRSLRLDLGLKRGELDVLIGCPPCQGFSRMRNGRGASDERNTLILKYLEFVREFRPAYGMFENVPGLLRTAYGKEFYESLFDGLRGLGYGVARRELEAADYGVPQLRRRVIVLIGRDGEVPPFPWPTHAPPESTAVSTRFRHPWLTVRDAIGHYPDPSSLSTNQVGNVLANHVLANLGERVRRFIELVPKDGGSRTDVPEEYWLTCHQNHRGHGDVYGRLAWHRPANTMTTGCTNPSKGRFIHPEQNRGITAREAAALQGFPDQYVFYVANMGTQIGNAVPPPLAYHVALTILGRLAPRS